MVSLVSVNGVTVFVVSDFVCCAFTTVGGVYIAYRALHLYGVSACRNHVSCSDSPAHLQPHCSSNCNLFVLYLYTRAVVCVCIMAAGRVSLGMASPSPTPSPVSKGTKRVVELNIDEDGDCDKWILVQPRKCAMTIHKHGGKANSVCNQVVRCVAKKCDRSC